MSHLPDYLFPWILFLIPITILLVGRIRYGSFKGAFFGARIVGTIGEVSGIRHMGMQVKIKIHQLERRDAEPLIGLEITTRAPLSYHMMPVRMDPAEAERFAGLLHDAVHGGHNENRSIA